MVALADSALLGGLLHMAPRVGGGARSPLNNAPTKNPDLSGPRECSRCGRISKFSTVSRARDPHPCAALAEPTGATVPPADRANEARMTATASARECRLDPLTTAMGLPSLA